MDLHAPLLLQRVIGLNWQVRNLPAQEVQERIRRIVVPYKYVYEV